MAASIIDGKEIARQIRAEVKAEAERLRKKHGLVPGLAFILVGENPASEVYVRMKGKGCEEVGFYSVTERLPESIHETELITLIYRFNKDPKIHGILVQLPLPDHINNQKILESLSPSKDVDGFHPVNVGKLVIGEETLRPCTPAGIQELLIRSGNDPGGKHVVVVGRSNIVGKPVANILAQKKKGANAVVTLVHTGAGDLGGYTRTADVLIAAIGKPEVIRGEMLKPGAVVIDVGINRVGDPSARNGFRIVGDVHFESAKKVASAITPVPGGVGPMTIAMLLNNTLLAAQRSIAD